MRSVGGRSPSGGHPLKANNEACRGALVQRAACSRKKCLIPSFWKDSDVVHRLYGPVWNENPPSVVISYVLRQRHLVGAQCGGDRRAGHSRVPHGSRWECPSPAPAPVTCDPPHCSQRAATLALPRPSTARLPGSRPRPRGPAPWRDPPVGVGRGRAGVLGRVVGRRGQGRHELVQVQGWVGGSAVRRPAGRAGRPCRLREELETEHPRELVRASAARRAPSGLGSNARGIGGSLRPPGLRSLTPPPTRLRTSHSSGETRGPESLAAPVSRVTHPRLTAWPRGASVRRRGPHDHPPRVLRCARVWETPPAVPVPAGPRRPVSKAPRGLGQRAGEPSTHRRGVPQPGHAAPATLGSSGDSRTS